MKKTGEILKSACMILLCTFLFASCGKSPGCWGEDKNEGLIEESLNIPLLDAAGREGVVITSDSVYKSLFDTAFGKPPLIDFNTHSLLGLYASGGCAMKVKRDVISNTEKKEYLYKVIAKDCGLCKKMVIDYNCVKVPKLPPGWTVRFELKKK